MKTITAFFGALLFALGLGFAGMTSPEVIKAFFNFQNWNPSIGIMMAVGLMIYIPSVIFAKKMKKPLAEEKFNWPEPEALSFKFFAGAILFGIAWGIGGICPGPGIVITGALSIVGPIFIISLVIGMSLATLIAKD